jgi:hypothetical protein
MNGTVGLAAPASGWVGYDYGHARQSMTSTGHLVPATHIAQPRRPNHGRGSSRWRRCFPSGALRALM